MKRGPDYIFCLMPDEDFIPDDINVRMILIAQDNEVDVIVDVQNAKSPIIMLLNYNRLTEVYLLQFG